MSKTLIVRMRRVVTTEVTVEDCTEEEAATNPWEFAVDEQDIDQTDWEVLDVREAL
jgi:hypothetical protein